MGIAKYKAGDWASVYKLNPITGQYVQKMSRLTSSEAEFCNMRDHSRHFVDTTSSVIDGLNLIGRPVKFYKTVVTVHDDTKRNEIGDLCTYGGFCAELTAWMLERNSDFYVIYDFCHDNELGEVVFLDPQDLDDFHTEFLPALEKKRPFSGIEDYFMPTWPGQAEYEFHRDAGKAPDKLWTIEVDWREWGWFDNSDGWTSEMPTNEGMEVWLQLRSMPFQKRFYVFDEEKKPSTFAFEEESDMILFAAWLNDYKERNECD